MLLKKVSVPPESIEKFNLWVSQRNAGREVGEDHSIFDESYPHKVFHASLHDISTDIGFGNANQVAWRHLHTDASGNHHALETSIEKSGQHHHQEVHRGIMVDEMKALVLALEEMHELQGKTYELAYLRLFSLKVCALWLRATHREKDYFIPLSPCFHGFRACHLYTSSDFLGITRQAVQAFTSNAARLGADNMLGS